MGNWVINATKGASHVRDGPCCIFKSFCELVWGTMWTSKRTHKSINSSTLLHSWFCSSSEACWEMEKAKNNCSPHVPIRTEGYDGGHTHAFHAASVESNRQTGLLWEWKCVLSPGQGQTQALATRVFKAFSKFSCLHPNGHFNALKSHSADV